MENKLTALFDYQRFENNTHLEKLICETEAQYSAELSDDSLSEVSAAGETDILKDPPDTEVLPFSEKQ